MNKNKYSLRAVLLNEAVTSVGFMKFNIDENSPFAKAIRGEAPSAGALDFSSKQIDDYFDDGRPKTNNRSELDLIIVLSMLHTGVSEKFGKGPGRTTTGASSSQIEELVKAALPGAKNINNQAFGNNEPFADVFYDNQWISVKFTQDPGSSVVKKKQMDQMMLSLETRRSGVSDKDYTFKIVEIGHTEEGFDILTIGPTTKSKLQGTITTASGERKTSSIADADDKVPTSTVSLKLPNETFFKELDRIGFLSGQKLTLATASPVGATAAQKADGVRDDVAEVQRTYSGSIAKVAGLLSNKVADFVEKTGREGGDSIKDFNSMQKLIITAMQSLKGPAKIDNQALTKLHDAMEDALRELDSVDGLVDNEIDLTIDAEKSLADRLARRWIPM